jgi:hypothetical protein
VPPPRPLWPQEAERAKAAGAEIVGAEELVKAIQDGELNFDRCIASPEVMPLVSRVARVSGGKRGRSCWFGDTCWGSESLLRLAGDWVEGVAIA